MHLPEAPLEVFQVPALVLQGFLNATGGETAKGSTVLAGIAENVQVARRDLPGGHVVPGV